MLWILSSLVYKGSYGISTLFDTTLYYTTYIIQLILYLYYTTLYYHHYHHDSTHLRLILTHTPQIIFWIN